MSLCEERNEHHLLNIERLTVLKRCRSCKYEETTSSLCCPECKDSLITVTISALDGRRLECADVGQYWGSVRRYSRPVENVCGGTTLAALGLPPTLFCGEALGDDDIPF